MRRCTSPPVERFPALDALEDVLHGFTLRVPELDVRTGRETALRRLDRYSRNSATDLGERQVRLAEQVHHNSVTVVTVDSGIKSAGVDALITRDPKIPLGTRRRLLRRILGRAETESHRVRSLRRKGTELNIAAAAVQKMATEFGTDPVGLLAQLSPCIRPPNYEVDFAGDIVQKLKECGSETRIRFR